MGNDLNFAFDDKNNFVPDEPVLDLNDPMNLGGYPEDEEEDTSIEVEAEAQNEPVSDVKSPEPTKTATKQAKKEYDGSYAFRATLKEELDQRALADPLFAVKYADPKKTIDDCANYIIGEAFRLKVNGMPDDEVYGLAVHYYTEDDLTITPASVSRVISNHTVELTPEEIEQAHQDAIITEQKEYLSRIKKPGIAAPKKKVEMPSLF